jgi:sugar/nucleoside kinase (ribokinase family)
MVNDKGEKQILTAPGANHDLRIEDIHLVRPNSGEARVLTGVQSRDRSTARRAAQALLAKGVRAAIVQAGNHGNLFVTSDEEHWMPNIPVKSIDATGAGDAFLGTRQTFRGGRVQGAFLMFAS